MWKWGAIAVCALLIAAWAISTQLRVRRRNVYLSGGAVIVFWNYPQTQPTWSVESAAGQSDRLGLTLPRLTRVQDGAIVDLPLWFLLVTAAAPPHSFGGSIDALPSATVRNAATT